MSNSGIVAEDVIRHPVVALLIVQVCQVIVMQLWSLGFLTPVVLREDSGPLVTRLVWLLL